MTHLPKWTPRPESNLILWGETLDTPELLRDFRIEKEVDDSTYHSAHSIFKST